MQSPDKANPLTLSLEHAVSAMTDIRNANAEYIIVFIIIFFLVFIDFYFPQLMFWT